MPLCLHCGPHRMRTLTGVNGRVVRLLRRVWGQNNSNEHIQGVLVQMTALRNVSDCTRRCATRYACNNGSIARKGLTMWGHESKSSY